MAETSIHMLQCQIQNKEAWNTDLQQGLTKSGLVLGHQALIIYCIKCFGSNTTPTITNNHSSLAQTLVKKKWDGTTFYVA